MNEPVAEKIARAMIAIREARGALDRISEEKKQSDPEVLEAVRKVSEAQEALRAAIRQDVSGTD